MSGARLSGPIGRIAALGLLAGLLALFWLGLAQPLFDRRATLRAEIETASLQAARFRATAREPAPPPPAAPDSAMLDATDPTLAVAALQRRIDAAATRAGGARLSAQARPPQVLTGVGPDAIGGAMRIRLVIDARFDAEGLRDFLHEIETGEPWLFVEALEARRIDGSLDSPDALPTELAVRLTLDALMPGEAPPAPAAGEL